MREALRRVALAALVALLAEPAPTPAPAPKYGPQAVRLHEDHGYLREREARDFWALIPYYVPQQTDSSCSAASLAMLVNGLRAERALGADTRLVTHAELVQRIGDRFAKAVAEGGDGVSLDQLGALVERALRLYAIAGYQVDVVHTPDASAATLAQLRAALETNEASGRDFVLANFLQSELTGDPDGAVGHIAPLAAYDAARRRALVLDPDRSWYEPYWVPDEALLRAMSVRDPASGGPRGYVWVRPRPEIPR